MKSLFALCLVLVSLSVYAATDPAKEAACNEFSNAAMNGQPTEIRLDKTLASINLSYELGYTPEQMAKLQSKLASMIADGKISLDGIERVALFACMNDLDAEDKAPVKEFFANLVNGTN